MVVNIESLIKSMLHGLLNNTINKFTHLSFNGILTAQVHMLPCYCST